MKKIVCLVLFALGVLVCVPSNSDGGVRGLGLRRGIGARGLRGGVGLYGGLGFRGLGLRGVGFRRAFVPPVIVGVPIQTQAFVGGFGLGSGGCGSGFSSFGMTDGIGLGLDSGGILLEEDLLLQRGGFRRGGGFGGFRGRGLRRLR